MSVELERLADEIAALRQEIHLLRTGRLVARLTEAEKDELARAVAERLEPVLAALQRGRVETPPKRPKKRRRSLLRDDD